MKQRVVKIRCSRCRGTGYLYHSGVQQVTCKVCLGTGKMEVKR